MRVFVRSLLAIVILFAASGASGSALAQDAQAGAQVFKKCATCHSTDGTKRVGPTLAGVIGRQAGSAPGFRYSRAMKGAMVVWDDATLDAYLVAPKAFIPGNVMAFSGLPQAEDRANLIAYLNTLK
ncbi:cytochrome c family protein [Pelagibius sp. 7325]|uniref:c-type cytochrome n=1 Tax=Pelagibius sp. 7325 TaxID=3131994 RepID=UPI0030EF7064